MNVNPAPYSQGFSVPFQPTSLSYPSQVSGNPHAGLSSFLDSLLPPSEGTQPLPNRPSYLFDPEEAKRESEAFHRESRSRGDASMRELQRLLDNQTTASGLKFEYDDRELMAFLKHFIADGRELPEYKRLKEDAARETGWKKRYLDDLLEDVDMCLERSVVLDNSGRYSIEPLLTTALSCSICLDGEDTSKSVYVCLRNAVFSLPQQRVRLEFLKNKGRTPKEGDIGKRDINEYIVGVLGSQYEQFEGKDKDPEDYIAWIIIFDTLILNAIEKLIDDLVRRVNLVSRLRMKKIPTSVAEVEEFIRAERRERSV